MNESRVFHVFETPLEIQLLPPIPPTLSGQVVVSATFKDFTVTAKGPQMAYTLQNDMQVLLQVQFQDVDGNPAKVDGDPVWSSSDDLVASITPAAGNPFLATLLGTGMGNAQVIVEADADTGDGVRSLVCTLDVTIIAGEAVGGVISPAGEPSPPSPGGG